MDLRWRTDLTTVIATGVLDGTFPCDDAVDAAWRIKALPDGLAVQVSVHHRIIPRRPFTERVRLATARELGLDPAQLA